MKVVIIGAGPAGNLLSVFLAKQGHSVELFEKRAKPDRRPTEDNTQAYLLNLNTRSIENFKLAGIGVDDLVKFSGPRITISMYGQNGKRRHRIEGKITKENPTMMRVFRDEITRHLIDAATSLHPSAINHHFEEELQHVDFAAQTITISSKEGTREVGYDLLVGADGATSKVRTAIADTLPKNFIKQRFHSVVYTIGMLQAPKGTFPDHTFMELHNFTSGAVVVNGRGDGDIRCGVFAAEPEFLSLKNGDKEWLLKQLSEELPVLSVYAKSAICNIIRQNSSYHHIAGWTYLSQLYGNKVALIGDAAHTFTPMLGQGCNAGLQDAFLLAEALQQNPQDLEGALKTYNARRLPDITALVMLNEIAASERQLVTEQSEREIIHELWLNCHAIMMTVHTVIGRKLHQSMPSIFPMPCMTQSLMGMVPYRKVFPAMYRDSAALAAVGALAVVGLYAASASLHRNWSHVSGAVADKLLPLTSTKAS